MELREAIRSAASLIKQSAKIAVLTGAGISKESGVPTFRDAQDGLWAQYDPMQLATPNAFRQNPKLVWEWYQYRRALIKDTKPNPGHISLARLEELVPEILIITQNVDNLHETAGSRSIVHLHGNIAEDKCFADCQGDPTLIDINTLEWHPDDGPPHCPHCGAYVRPNVVWFGEILPARELTMAQQASAKCDLMLIIGTSGIVYPAAGLPLTAARNNAKLVEINPDTTDLKKILTLHLAGPSGEILPMILEELDA